MYSPAIFGFSCIVLLGRVLGWIVGARLPDYYSSDILTSIPLVPQPAIRSPTGQ
jgi:hypothetical protein